MEYVSSVRSGCDKTNRVGVELGLSLWRKNVSEGVLEEFCPGVGDVMMLTLSGVWVFSLKRNVVFWILVTVSDVDLLVILNMDQAALTCAKMSSISWQNCPSEYMVETSLIQVTDISFPPSAPLFHSSLLTSCPPSFAYFCHPSFSLSYKGRLYHVSHLPRKQSASTPNQRRFVESRSVRGFLMLCFLM